MILSQDIPRRRAKLLVEITNGFERIWVIGLKKKKKKRYGERTCEDNGRMPMINERVTGEERDKLFTFFTHGV